MNTDPISDYLTRVRNAITAKKKRVEIPSSNMKKRMSEILLNHSFIEDFKILDTPDRQGKIVLTLKYFKDESVILGLKRESKPGLRKYVNRDELPKVLNGLGIAIVSTSKGLMTDKDARKQGIGGEVVCSIW